MTLTDEATDARVELIQQVVSIVSAYVSHNAMRAGELPDLIGAVHLSIQQLSKEKAAVEAKPPENPAVPVKRSVSKDFIVCLECGKKFKSLRRHLSSFHSLTPDEYRAKWSLQSDYPMVAPAYSATRSQLARDSGLGQISRGEASAEAPSALGAEGDKDVRDDEVAIEAAADEVVEEAPQPAAAETAEAAEPAKEPEAKAAEAPKKPRRGRPRKVAA